VTVYFRQQVTSRFQLTPDRSEGGNFFTAETAAEETGGGGVVFRETGGLVVNQ